LGVGRGIRGAGTHQPPKEVQGDKRVDRKNCACGGGPGNWGDTEASYATIHEPRTKLMHGQVKTVAGYGRGGGGVKNKKNWEKKKQWVYTKGKTGSCFKVKTQQLPKGGKTQI